MAVAVAVVVETTEYEEAGERAAGGEGTETEAERRGEDDGGGGWEGVGRGKRLSTHRSYHVSRTHADLVVFMPAVNHVEGLICRWLLWTGINACSASHFVTANAVPSVPLPPSTFAHPARPTGSPVYTLLFWSVQHFQITGTRSMICTSTLPIF